MDYIKRNYGKFYSSLEIESKDTDIKGNERCVFWLASKRQPGRKVKIELTP